MINCSSPKSIDSFSQRIVNIATGPGGIIQACISLLTNQTCCVFINVGTSIISKFEFKTEFKTDFSLTESSINWKSSGDAICVTWNDELLFIEITYFSLEGQSINLLEALDQVEVDHPCSDFFEARMTIKSRLSEHKFTTATIAELGRYIYVGTHHGNILKYSWEGSFIHSYDVISESQVVAPLKAVNIELKPFLSHGDDVSKTSRKVFPKSWNDSTRILTILFEDGSLSFCHITGQSFYCTNRLFLVFLLKISQYSELIHPNRNAVGKPFYSLIMNTEEIQQHYVTQSKSSGTRWPSSQSSGKLHYMLEDPSLPSSSKNSCMEVVSKIHKCRIVDVPFVCPTDSFSCVCLVLSRHFPLEEILEDRSVIEESSSKLESSFTKSLVYMNISYKSTNHFTPRVSDKEVENGNTNLKQPNSQVDMNSNQSITLEIISIVPIKDITPSGTGRTTPRTPVDLNTISNNPIENQIEFNLIYTSADVILLLVVDHHLSCRSLPNLSSIYFIIDLSDTPIYHNSFTSKSGSSAKLSYLTSLTLEGINMLISDDRDDQFKTDWMQIPLIHSLHSSMLCQTKGTLLSLGNHTSLHIHNTKIDANTNNTKGTHWEEILFENDLLDEDGFHNPDSSITSIYSQLHDTIGHFQNIKLPYRLSKELKTYNLRATFSSRSQPGCSIQPSQVSLLVARAVSLTESMLSSIQYVAASVGGSLIVPNLSHLKRNVNNRPLTVWIHNCSTNRWRETYLDINDDKNDKSVGSVQMLSEIRSVDFMPVKGSESRQLSPIEEDNGMNGTLFGHLSNISGPLQSLLALAWYENHSLVTIGLRRSRFCLEVFSRGATRSSLQVGKPRPLVHRVYPLPIGFCPKYFNLITLPNLSSKSCFKGDSVNSTPRVNFDLTPRSPHRRLSNASHTNSISSMSPFVKPGQSTCPLNTRAIVIVGDGQIFYSFNIQAFVEKSQSQSQSNIQKTSSVNDPKSDIKNYDISLIWDFDFRTLPKSMTSKHTISVPFKDVIAVPISRNNTVWNEAKSLKNSNELKQSNSGILSLSNETITSVLDSIDLCMFILGYNKKVICINPAFAKIVSISDHAFDSIEYCPTNLFMKSVELSGLTMNSPENTNDNEEEKESTSNIQYLSINDDVLEVLGSVLLHRHSNPKNSKTSKVWLPSPIAMYEYEKLSNSLITFQLSVVNIIAPLTTCLNDEIPFGVVSGALTLSSRARVTVITPLLTMPRENERLPTKKDLIEKSVQLTLSTPTGNYATSSYSIHFQIMLESLYVIVNYILSKPNTRKTSANSLSLVQTDMDSSTHINISVAVICGILTSLSLSPQALDIFIPQIEICCKDLVYDICATRTNGPSYSKAGVEFRLITSFLYHYVKDVFFELIGLLGRKLEPDISTRLFPLYIVYDLNNLRTRDMNNQLVFSPLHLYEKCLDSKNYLQASRFLTLACDHVGGSESSTTLCNSLILSMELLYHSIEEGLLPLALECIDFCHRLEDMLLCLCDTEEDVRDSLRFSSNRDVLKLLINNSLTGIRASEFRSSIITEVRGRSITSDTFAQGLSGGLFSALAMVSPTLSYYLGGGVIWAISRTIEAFIQSPIEGSQYGNRRNIEPSVSANRREGSTRSRKYQAFASVLAFHGSIIQNTSLNSQLESGVHILENPSYAIRLVLLCCREILNNKKYYLAATLIMSLSSLSSPLKDRLKSTIKSRFISALRPQETIEQDSVMVVKYLSLHRLVLESSLRRHVRTRVSREWLDERVSMERASSDRISLDHASSDRTSSDRFSLDRISLERTSLDRTSSQFWSSSLAFPDDDKDEDDRGDNGDDAETRMDSWIARPDSTAHILACLCVALVAADRAEVAAMLFVTCFAKCALAARLAFTARVLELQRHGAQRWNDDFPVIRDLFEVTIDELFDLIWPNDRAHTPVIESPLGLSTVNSRVEDLRKVLSRTRAMNEYSTVLVTVRRLEKAVADFWGVGNRV